MQIVEVFWQDVLQLVLVVFHQPRHVAHIPEPSLNVQLSLVITKGVLKLMDVVIDYAQIKQPPPITLNVQPTYQHVDISKVLALMLEDVLLIQVLH